MTQLTTEQLNRRMLCLAYEGKLDLGLDGRLPNDIKVLGYHERAVEEFYPYSDGLRDKIKTPMEGLDNFLEYLRETCSPLGTFEPEIELAHAKKNAELYEPTLDSFSGDNRIVIYPLKKFGVEFDLEAKAMVGGRWISVSTTQYDPRGAHHFMEYDFDDEGLFPNRFPLKISDEGSYFDRYTHLARSVLKVQLESGITNRISEKLDNLAAMRGDYDEIESFEFSAMISQEEYELDVVSNAILKRWILEKTPEEVRKMIEFNPNGINNADADASLNAVLENGVERSIEYFLEEFWDFDRFKRGDY
ncbi:hypothetical protein HOD75_02935 [archaeon]|jgi:hypothetical protein|nr:hypothetical protein [Candidatus Woesearchaeota archaeon]MBT4135618.1 hypothetical protein [archaeon]MBT4241829.1 hypothetical protein [archaeon]MBT4418377.1 hypothetical protein [archaeon]